MVGGVRPLPKENMYSTAQDVKKKKNWSCRKIEKAIRKRIRFSRVCDEPRRERGKNLSQFDFSSSSARQTTSFSLPYPPPKKKKSLPAWKKTGPFSIQFYPIMHSDGRSRKEKKRGRHFQWHGIHSPLRTVSDGRSLDGTREGDPESR